MNNKVIFKLLPVILVIGVTCASAQNSASRPEPQGTAPTTNASADDQFVIGEADVLQIGVWQEPQLSTTATVRPDGSISLLLLNEVKVAGLTTTKLQALLEEKYKSFLTDPHVSVTVSEIRSRKVFITGEIPRPGSYPLLTPTTVLQLIAQAGGFTPFSKKNKVTVLRTENGRQTRLRFNYSAVMKGESAADSIILKPGDTVVVP